MTIGRDWFNTAFQYLLDHSEAFPYAPIRHFFHDILPRVDHTFASNTNQFEQVALEDVINANTAYSEGLLTAIGISSVACALIALFFLLLFTYYGTLGRKKWSREEYLQIVDMQKGWKKLWGRRTCQMLISLLIVIVSAAAMIISQRLTNELDTADDHMERFATHMEVTSVDIDMVHHYTDQVYDAVQDVLDAFPSNPHEQFNASMSELFEEISDYTDDIVATYSINPMGQVDEVLAQSIAYQDEKNSDFQGILYSLSEVTYLSYAVLIGLLFLNFLTLCHTRTCAKIRRAASILDVLVFVAVAVLSALTLSGALLLSDFCDNPGSHWISMINNAGPYAWGPKLTLASSVDPSSPVTNVAQYNAQRRSTAMTLAYYGICAASKGSGEFTPESYNHPYATWAWGVSASDIDDLYAINAKINYGMHPYDMSPKTGTGTYAAASVMTYAEQLHANSEALHYASLSNYTLTWAEASTSALTQQSQELSNYAKGVSNALSLHSVCPIVNGNLHALCGEAMMYTTVLWSLSIVLLVLFIGLLISTVRLCSFHPGDVSLARAVVPLTLMPGEKLEDTDRPSALIVAMGLAPIEKRKKQEVQENIVLETSAVLSPDGENEATWKY